MNGPKQFNHVEGILAGQPIELTDFQLFMALISMDFTKGQWCQAF
ncbi:hypothetical protein ACEQPO_14055 [Bacillus sp. SL00103]